MEALIGLIQAVPSGPGVFSIEGLIDLLGKAGVLGALVAFVWLLLTDRIYTRGRYEDMVSLLEKRIEALEQRNAQLMEDNEAWRDVARDKQGTLEDAVGLAATRLRRRRGDPP